MHELGHSLGLGGHGIEVDDFNVCSSSEKIFHNRQKMIYMY